MSGQFRTTADEMRAFSARISEVNAQIQQELNRLNNVVSGVTAGWQGHAASSYQQLQQKWVEDAGKLNRVLGEIKDAIDNTSNQYSSTEQEQQAGLSRITSALG
ncbi:WXG100 family type VII secretion target [Streptacidiphilus jiangxiensis]|uniref:ESAT-6-like protein n=1 Tax=Streptacidiphilus jiangxiensis TaxID=235985 RepID=A0A1H7ZRK6_STRJI|nr:WXG100 family type VII secretion target [Streptacidiphilus jiangxiensis]SEM61065.1 WXG100 family type VII secretion target [Streptacidiphilus jiangxiensis]